MKAATNQEQARDQERRVKNKRQQELDDVLKLLESQHGRRFLMRMLDITGFQRSSFTGNSTTFFNEGARNIGLQLWADLQEMPPELFIKMLQEQREKENA